jgi:hypothetical protein
VSSSQTPEAALTADPASVAVRGAGEFVTSLLLHPDMPAGLALAAGAMAFVGSQVPQVHAPLVTGDGFDRPDLLQFAALGLDRATASLPAVVILAVALALGVARLLVAREGNSQPLAASQEAAVKVLQRAWQATGAQPLAVVARGGSIVVRAGLPRLGPPILASAAVAAWMGGVAAGELDGPVFVDVPLGAAPANLDASVADAGTLGTAPGRWRGHCARAGETVHCQLEWPGGSGSATLAPGRAAVIGEHHMTWVANGPEPSAGTQSLRWQKTPGRPPVAMALHAGQPVTAPGLGLRATPLVADVAGPAVFVVPQSGAERPLRVLASPQIVPGRPVATVRVGERVRLIVAPNRPAWAVAAIALLAAVGFVISFALPNLHASIDAHGNVSRLRCNRPRVLAALPHL